MDDDEDEREFSKSIVYDYFTLVESTFQKMNANLYSIPYAIPGLQTLTVLQRHERPPSSLRPCKFLERLFGYARLNEGCGWVSKPSTIYT